MEITSWTFWDRQLPTHAFTVRWDQSRGVTVPLYLCDYVGCNCAIVLVWLCNEPLLSASQTYFHFSATSAGASVQVLDLGLCLLYSYLPVSRRASAVVVAFREWPWSQDSQSHFSGKPWGWGRLAAPGRVGCSGWHHHTIPRPSLWTCPGSHLSSPPGPQSPPVCSRALYIHIYIHADTHTQSFTPPCLSLSLSLCLTAIQSPTDIILLCSTGLFHFCSLVFSQEYKPFFPSVLLRGRWY